MSSIAEKGNPIKEFVLPAGILTLICTIAAAALVCTYQVTNPIIEENTRKAADAARAEVYTGVSGFEELSADGLENVTEVYKTSGGEGYVFTTTSKGFGGTIKVWKIPRPPALAPVLPCLLIWTSTRVRTAAFQELNTSLAPLYPHGALTRRLNPPLKRSAR